MSVSKQDIIREGIEHLRREAFGDCGSGYFTDALIKYLHVRDVVIKVDREFVVPAGCSIPATLLLMLKEAGCVAVKPLIEEKVKV